MSFLGIKDKKKIILLCIGICALIVFAVAFISNIVINRMHNYAIYCGTVAMMWEHVSTDEEFIEEYGKPVEYEYAYDFQETYTNIEDDCKSASFYIKTESGEKYLLTVGWECLTEEESVFKYTEVKKSGSFLGN